MNTNLKVVGLTRLEIKSGPTTPEVDAFIIRQSQLFIHSFIIVSEKRMQNVIKAVVLEEHEEKKRKVSTGKRVAAYGCSDEKTGVIISTRKPVNRAENEKTARQIPSSKKIIITGAKEEKFRKISMPAKLECVATTGMKITDDRINQNHLRVKQPKTVRFSPTSSPVTSPDVTPVNPRRNISKKSPTPSPTQSPMTRRNVLEVTYLYFLKHL